MIRKIFFSVIMVSCLLSCSSKLDEIEDHIAQLEKESQELKNQADRLSNIVVAELAGHGTEDTGTHDLVLLGQQHASVVVEADVGTVGTADLLLGTDDDGIGNRALLGVAARNGALDGDDDLVADSGIAVAGTTEDADAEHFLRTRVVSHQQT